MPRALILIARVSHVVPPAHAPRVTDHAIELILMLGSPRLVVSGILELEDQVAVLTGDLVDHEVVQGEGQGEGDPLRVLAKREATTGLLETL